MRGELNNTLYNLIILDLIYAGSQEVVGSSPIFSTLKMSYLRH